MYSWISAAASGAGTAIGPHLPQRMPRTLGSDLAGVFSSISALQAFGVGTLEVGHSSPPATPKPFSSALRATYSPFSASEACGIGTASGAGLYSIFGMQRLSPRLDVPCANVVNLEFV